MKRNAVLCCDIIVSIVVYVWSLLGPWDQMLGFSVYHSRGDVWLPMPPAAADFFRAMVSTGTAWFAILFLLSSCVIFYLGRGASTDQKRGILYQMFYGDALKLAVKYFAFLAISFIAPFFYNYMWRFGVTRPFKIADGHAISIASFMVVLAIAELVSRIAPQRRPALNL
jgi:hypothetical protein